MDTATDKKPLRYIRDEQPGAVFYYSPPRVVATAWGQIYPGQRHPGGYGRKIATDYVCRYGGRTRRVYCCCFSNSGTCYVIERGEWLIVDDIPDRENLPTLPR